MEIVTELNSVGTTYFEHQTSVQFIINNEEYWFTIITKGSNNSTEIDYDIENDEDIPFELTDEIKDQLIEEYLLNEPNYR